MLNNLPGSQLGAQAEVNSPRTVDTLEEFDSDDELPLSSLIKTHKLSTTKKGTIDYQYDS